MTLVLLSSDESGKLFASVQDSSLLFQEETPIQFYGAYLCISVLKQLWTLLYSLF